MNLFGELFKELQYTRYALDRSGSPAITPESWKNVYGDDVAEFEARYQAEKAIAKARTP